MQVVPGMRARVTQLALNGALFGLAYPLTNQAAQRALVTRHVAMAWEACLPFLPWMVVPYMTSGLFFILSFLLVRRSDDLSALSRRMAFATVTACLVFAVFPLRFALPRPAVDAALPAWLYAQLAAMDQPYNQLPSLHVAYCVIFWAALRPVITSAWLRAMLATWLVLVAASTLFTWQHHALDVIAGAVLGAAALRLPPAPQDRKPVDFVYALLASLALLAWLLWGGWAWIYLSASLLLVARAYYLGDAAFLRKRSGRYRWWSWLMYAPYLCGYMLTWQLVRWRERHRPPFSWYCQGLWIGRRLTNTEAAQLPEDCAVIDLANELSETPALRRHNYHHFPLLDLCTPDQQSAKPILSVVHQHIRAGRPVYLHCAMGYRRSREIAHLYEREYRQS